MLNVRESAGLGASADEVWALVSDFVGLIAALGLPVQGEGEGVGAVRTLSNPKGDIVERLEALDNDNRTLTYALVQPGPMPVRDYTSTMTVEADGAGRSVVVWTADFEADGAPDEKATSVVSRTYQGGLAGLQKRFGA